LYKIVIIEIIDEAEQKKLNSILRKENDDLFMVLKIEKINKNDLKLKDLKNIDVINENIIQENKCSCDFLRFH
jgi:hypothetical protein